MKKLLFFAALVLGTVSCMKDNSFEANVGGEADVVLSVALPADVTRAINQDSSKGAIGNIDLAQYDIRYILEVFDANNTLAKRVENYEDTATETTFELRLIPGRHYSFVVWADFVAQGSEDALHYNAEDLRNIEIIGAQNAMDESRDAYTGIFRTSDNGGQPFSSSSQIGFELKRPFAKLRVVANDIDEIYSSLVSATIEYTAQTYQQYDALTKVSSELATVTKSVDFASEAYLYAGEPTAEGEQTLFADYILGTQNGTVQFIMTIADDVQALPAINFNTAIPVQTNYLTTIYGPILTDYNNVTVTINPAFENEGNFEEAPYYQVTVTNGVELIKALMQGREIIVLNDITVTAADLAEATRAGEAINPVIYLNGFTITVENNEAEALVDLNGGVLTVEGEGAIESTTGALVETIYNVGEATIADNAATEPVVNCLSEIRAAFANGGEYTMVCDLAISESLTLATGKELVFDLNGKTLTGAESSTGSFGLITNKGNLTVKNGTITLKAEKNREWNAYSSVISNTVGGNLVVENATIEHFGGTDMAYGIDNLTNGKGTYAETTVNSGAVVKSPYRAIRQFLNGIEAQNILTVNAGAVVEGTNKSIWMQDPSAKANTGKLVVNEGATLNGDVYLYVTAGSTEWPVEVSIAASAVNGEVLTGNVPAGYEVVEKDGVWTVVAYTKVANTDELIAALKACQPIILTDNITVTSKWDNRYTGAKTTKAITIDGNGNTLKFACEVSDGFNYQAAFRFEAPAVVKNLTIDMSEVTGTGSWLRAISTKGDITVDNCTFIGNANYTSGRGIAYGEGAGAAAADIVVSVKNSTFTNWTRRGLTDNENAQDAKDVTVVNNTFTNADAYVSAHDSIVFTGNVMNSSAANFRTYSNATDATVVATGNTLDANNENNVIRGFVAANVESQEGFTIL